MDGLVALTTPASGEVWLADQRAETRRLVFIVSSARFHRLSGRAVVAPVLDHVEDAPFPWHIPLQTRTISVHQLGTVTVDRLLRRVDRADAETLRRVRHAVEQICIVG